RWRRAMSAQAGAGAAAAQGVGTRWPASGQWRAPAAGGYAGPVAAGGGGVAGPARAGAAGSPAATWGWRLLVLAVLLLYPAVASPFFTFQIGGQSLALGIIALSLALLGGYGGMVTLSQMTVAGVAGYALAI